MGWNPTPGNPSLLKELNQFLILDALRRYGSLSRSDLARITGLTPPTVGVIVKGLLEEGYLVEQASLPGSGVGRRPVPLALNPQAGIAVGVNVSPTKVLILAVNLLGQIQARRSFAIAAGASAEDVLEQVIGNVREMLAELRPRRVFGVGVGLHGPVDHQRGLLRFAPHLGWRNVPVADLLGAALPGPVVVDNGVRCMAQGELWFGAARGIENLVCVAVGTGIGAAIVLDGRLYRGADGIAGEIGHVTVDVEGPRCDCGNYGCLETLASGPAIARQAARRLKQGVPSLLVDWGLDPDSLAAADVARAALAGDELSRQVFAEAGMYLGIAIANLAKTLNPSRILIGGGVAQAGDLLLEPLRRTLAQRTEGLLPGEVPVEPIQLGADAGAIGAACLVLERFFRGDTVPQILDFIER
ncbi:MAG: ROK family transcriptional regulator [Firmicutes bacterium]|nr:ROK family transcriptional regulator [Bacillota bacterium]